MRVRGVKAGRRVKLTATYAGKVVARGSAKARGTAVTVRLRFTAAGRKALKRKAKATLVVRGGSFRGGRHAPALAARRRRGCSRHLRRHGVEVRRARRRGLRLGGVGARGDAGLGPAIAGAAAELAALVGRLPRLDGVALGQVGRC